MNKPKCKLIGKNGNIFNLLAIASSCLKKNKMEGRAAEMLHKVSNARSYNEALSIIGQYVEIY
jgi:hypothetical protein